MNKTRSNKLFFCEHLFDRENVIYEIRNGFSISNKSGKGLEIFLKESASIEEESNCNRTYVVRDNNTEEIAAYFSLKAGLFSIEADMSENSDDIVSGFDTAPGIELAELYKLNMDEFKKKYPEVKKLDEELLKLRYDAEEKFRESTVEQAKKERQKIIEEEEKGNKNNQNNKKDEKKK